MFRYHSKKEFRFSMSKSEIGTLNSSEILL